MGSPAYLRTLSSLVITPHGTTGLADCRIACAKRFLESGERRCRPTDAAPADSPNMVIFSANQFHSSTSGIKFTA